MFIPSATVIKGSTDNGNVFPPNINLYQVVVTMNSRLIFVVLKITKSHFRLKRGLPQYQGDSFNA